MIKFNVKYSHYIILCFSFFTESLKAQNLIYNGSFELDVCPTVVGSTVGGNWGMTKESSWLNSTDINYTCSNICEMTFYGPNYMILYGDTANTGTCGKKSVYRSTSSSKFDKDYIAGGTLRYDTVRMYTSSYLSQILNKPLIREHTYYYYMFYTYYRMGSKEPPLPFKKINWYEDYNREPKITHNGFGVAFSTYINQFDKSFIFNNALQQLLPTTPNQRKLRFTISYSKNWQKSEGSFKADSAYTFISIGNFWKTEETNFNPPLKQSVQEPIFFYLDSINLWDVTHRIVAKRQYCQGQKTILHAENFSRGNTTWHNAKGVLLSTTDSLQITVNQDSLIISTRYFYEIEYTTIDSFWLRVKNTPPAFSILRQNDTCKLPAQLIAIPTNLNYTWNGISNGSNTFTTNQTMVINVIATDSNGCKAFASYTVNPEVKFTVSLISDSCSQTGIVEMIPLEYKYYNNQKIINNPFNTGHKGDIYIVAEQTNGCRDTQYFFIPLCTVQKDLLWLPNAFSPNNNNLNERFAPVGRFIKSYQLTIYNRWGQKIFVSDKSNPAWDGTFLDNPVPEGVYHYQISIELLNNQILNKTGSVTVVR